MRVIRRMHQSPRIPRKRSALALVLLVALVATSCGGGRPKPPGGSRAFRSQPAAAGYSPTGTWPFRAGIARTCEAASGPASAGQAGVRSLFRPASSPWTRRCHEHARQAIPTPKVLGRDVTAADPAVDAEEVDPVGLASEHALSFGGQSERKPSEDLSVAERRRGREVASFGLEQAAAAATERREHSVEPSVAEEGRLLELLRGHERRRRRARAGRDRFQRTPLAAG